MRNKHAIRLVQCVTKLYVKDSRWQSGTWKMVCVKDGVVEDDVAELW